MDVNVPLSFDALEQLYTTEAKALHDIGNSLSACGVGHIIDLPRIVVVGEQSAGKTSVLEAITRIRFPVEGSLGTRFATELVVRPSEERHISLSVKFADETKAPTSLHKEGFRDEDLPDMIDEAKRHMSFGDGDGNRFSKDVLHLEICGPKLYPLSLVDLPGLFHNLTETQTALDQDLVSDLVHSYVEQKNSIVLVVITANNQLASNMALNMVKAVDPQGLRTIGVVTKLDTIRPGLGDEKMCVRVIKNQEVANKLQLGWHVLRNRTGDNASLERRDEIKETFFKEGVWASIPAEDQGVDNLRRKLSRALYSHKRSGLPAVVAEIETNIRDRQEELEKFGKPRATQEEMRSFLLDIADDFQRLARDAINGCYNDHFFGGLDDERRKLRTQLRDFNLVFDYVLKNRGSKQVITKKPPPDDRIRLSAPYLNDFFERKPYDLLDQPTVSREALRQQLQENATVNQGRELFPGSPNNDLAVQLFKEQAEPWKKIAEHHIDCVTLISNVFVDNLFEYIAGVSEPGSTTEVILSTCVDPFFEHRRKVMRDKLVELLKPYKQGYALPMDVEFYDKYSQRSAEELADRVESILRGRHPDAFTGGRKTIDKESVKSAVLTGQLSDDDEFGVDKVVDMMMIYYNVS